LLTQGSNAEVARRLSAICAPFATVSALDHWMPRGFEATEECQLHLPSLIVDRQVSDRLAGWWLPATQLRDRTPNFDIAATCTVDGRSGILLVEAKAHDNELIHESVGRRVNSTSDKNRASRDSSHKTIRAAIDEARNGLNAQTGLIFKISVDSHYQISNRFAWAWKLAVSRYPVVLVYLGFLNADDMDDKGKAFRTHDEW